MTASRLLLWCSLALVVPVASGQDLDPQISVVGGDAIHVRWDGSDVAEWTVTNTGPVAVDVTFSLDDGGWTTNFAGKYDSVTLDPTDDATVTVRVTPGTAERANGTGAPLVLTASATDAAGRPATASASVATTFIAAPIPPPPVAVPPPPPDTTVRDFTLGAVLVAAPLFIAYVVVGFLFQVRVPREAVQVRGVRGAWVHVRVRNLAPWPQSVAVSLRRPGAGWQVAGDADRVTVKGRREETYTVYVRRLGANADAAKCRIGVRARRGFLYPWRTHGSLVVEYEPMDLTGWSQEAIGAAMQDAGMNGATPTGSGGAASLAADLRPAPGGVTARRKVHPRPPRP